MRDVHIHLERGNYTKEWFEKFVETAVKRNLDEIWILEHTHRFVEFMPMYENLAAYGEEHREWLSHKGSRKLQDYLDLISDMKKESWPVSIKYGLEVCYFPGQEKFVENEIKPLGLDFLTGSVHWIDGFGFDQRKEMWQGKNTDDEYRRYYEIMGELIDSHLFDGLAHPDSIKCFGYYADFDLKDIYHNLGKSLAAADMYAEESSGLYNNYNYPERGMNREMFRIFKEENVKLEFASDAHRPEDVGRGFPEMHQADFPCH